MLRQELDPFKVSSPRIFLVRMMVFLTIGVLVVVILNRQIKDGILRQSRAQRPDHRRAAGRHPALLPPGAEAVSRDRLGQQLPARRSRPCGRARAGAARADGGDPARPRRPHGDVLADHAQPDGFDREPSRRGARHVALHDRPPGLPRPARHLLGPDRDRRLGRQSDRRPQGGRRRRLDVRVPQGGPRGAARRHGDFVLVLAVRPRRFADPRLPRSADEPGAEPVLHRARGLARHHGARSRQRGRGARRPPAATSMPQSSD